MPLFIYIYESLEHGIFSISTGHFVRISEPSLSHREGILSKSASEMKLAADDHILNFCTHTQMVNLFELVTTTHDLFETCYAIKECQ